MDRFECTEFPAEDDTMFLSHTNGKLYLKFLRQLEIILFCLKRINVDKLLVILYRYSKAMKLQVRAEK